VAEKDLLFHEESRQIVGASIEVHNTLGHGFFEKIYENSLVVEFGLRNIPVLQQKQYPVVFKDVEVGFYIPDLICFDKVVVDTKTIEKITDHEVGQMLNYLKVTGHQLGLIINFKNAKLEWKRVAR
jgi:GxxExxY protein